MTIQLDVIRINRHNHNRDSTLRDSQDAAPCVRVIELVAADGLTDAIAKALGECTAVYVAVLEGDNCTSWEDLHTQMSELDQKPNAVASVPVCEAGSRKDLWRHFPAQIAALWERPSRPPVFRRAALLQLPVELSNAEPAWDCLIRVALHDQQIAVCELETDPREIDSRPLHDLVPNRPAPDRNWLLAHLQRLDLATVQPGCESSAEGTAFRAGLFQWHDYLDESHACAQEIEGVGKHRLGDHWHAIMHRREPDYGNSQYWFRRVGRSPVFPELTRRAMDVLESHTEAADVWQRRLIRNGEWDACVFVDLCEAAARGGVLSEIARRIQQAEMELLFDATFQEARGGKA